MINSIFETLTNILGGVAGLFTSIFESAANLVWTPGTGGGDGSLTLVGTLMLLAVGVSLFMFGFKFISRLVKLRG